MSIMRAILVLLGIALTLEVLEESLLVPDHTLLLVGIGVRKALDLTGLAAKETVEAVKRGWKGGGAKVSGTVLISFFLSFSLSVELSVHTMRGGGIRARSGQKPHRVRYKGPSSATRTTASSTVPT
jgi:hypothetical protein